MLTTTRLIAQAPEPPAVAPDTLLQRGSALVERIKREISSRTLERDERLAQARESREALDMLARAGAMPHAEREAARTLRSSAESVGRNLGAMEETIQAAREVRVDAQARIAAVAPLAHRAVRGAGPASRAALTWGLIMDHEKRRAQGAVETELRVEAMLAESADAKADIESQADARGQNTRLKPEEARRRRNELMSAIQGLNRLAAADNRALDDLEEFAAEIELAMAAATNSALPVARERLTALIDGAEDRIANGGAPAGRRVADAGRARNDDDPAPEAIAEVEDEPGGLTALGADSGAAAEIRIDDAASPNREIFTPKTDIEIYAPVAGAVIFSGAFADTRHILILDHGGGWATLYGNMSFCDLVEGDNVEAGQRLGAFTPGDPDEPIPFWFEVRLHGRSQAVKNWPAAGDDWRRRLFKGAAAAPKKGQAR